MSVSVSNISKNYGEQKAVDGISFEARPGEILGFLGPNGAGKSTTMKMLTCYIPPTSGTATVCGFDINQQPLEVRKQVGYLPELNPLYTDMFVKEYLYFMADVHKLGKAGHKAAESMIDRVGLTPERGKKIGQLSKGYKQRVGLAQAMLHNPKVLILDEPTSGLDPNQIVEIRNLIRQIGVDKTVILSTHIMQEVQALCRRVIIINKGKLVANSPVEELGKSGRDNYVVLEFNVEINEADLRNIPGVISTVSAGNNKWRVQSTTDVREQLFRFAVNNGIDLLSLVKEEQSLEDVFKQVTKE
ncbi:MAG: gliding motility-associated ABC transporter ATP-binding subunit GldA [Flavobacteriaceae bacterium]|nr:gliding motility-associated ABC transporter ATP-binding subunit GldA [Flavobacteriaceae bacterium]